MPMIYFIEIYNIKSHRTFITKLYNRIPSWFVYKPYTAMNLMVFSYKNEIFKRVVLRTKPYIGIQI